VLEDVEALDLLLGADPQADGRLDDGEQDRRRDATQARMMTSMTSCMISWSMPPP
jgi:hypothetical protein